MSNDYYPATIRQLLYFKWRIFLEISTNGIEHFLIMSQSLLYQIRTRQQKMRFTENVISNVRLVLKQRVFSSLGGSSTLCDTKADGFYPRSSDCFRLYRCVNKITYHFVCSNDLIFDPDQDTCEYPENVSAENTAACGLV